MTSTWFVILGILVAYVLVVWGVWRYARRRPPAEEGVCGRCGYSVKGLPSSICPECGSDLDVVGVRRASWWYRLRPEQRSGLVALVWTIGYGTAAWVAWVPFHEWVQPGRIEFREFIKVESPGKQIGVAIDRRVIKTCWSWEQDAVMSSITNPTHWGISIAGSETSLRFIPEWRKPFRSMRPEEDSTDEAEKLERWARDEETWKSPDATSWFFVLDGGNAYCWRGNLRSDLSRRDDYVYRQQDYEDSLMKWLQVWADRMNEPNLPELVLQTLPPALHAPLGQMGSTRNPLSYGQGGGGSGWGYSWKPDERLSYGYWLVVVFFYLVGFVRYTRSQPHLRAGRDVSCDEE